MRYVLRLHQDAGRRAGGPRHGDGSGRLVAALLRSRRDRLTPAQAGMAPSPGPRRVPGLRREELPVLAGLSADYHSRIEQGRQAHISAEVLDALAGALRPTDVERAHLRDLAAPARRAGVARRPRSVPTPGCCGR